MNKMNKIRMNFKKMEKLPEDLNRKWDNACMRKKKKEPSLRKREICSHFSWTLQTERMFFHPAARR